MAKERIKNILLVLLVVMNFVLGSRILTEKKLWPQGYNFFSNIGEFSKLYTNIKNYFTDTDEYKKKIFAPAKLIINTGDQTTRLSLNSANHEFDKIYEEAIKVLGEAFKTGAENATVVTKEELHSALTAESLYLELFSGYDIDVLAQAINVENSAIQNQELKVSDIVIVHKPRTEVYFADRQAQIYQKINVHKEFQALSEVLEECLLKHADKEAVINYSFDLKFDKPFGTQKTTLDPLIQIYSKAPECAVIDAQNPIAQGAQANEAIIKDILGVFNISPSTMRRYTEAGGTQVFVENNAILKIDKNGYLEYQATDGGMRISSADNEYTNVVNVSSIASEINDASGNSCDIRLSKTASNDDKKITYEYIVSGMPVKISDKNINSAVVAVVEDGILKSYKHLIRKYDVTSARVLPSEFFTSLDNVIAGYSEYMNEIKIDKMYLGYTDDGKTGEKTAQWIVSVNNIVAGE